MMIPLDIILFIEKNPIASDLMPVIFSLSLSLCEMKLEGE